MNASFRIVAAIIAIASAGCSTIPSREEMRSELSGYELPKVPSPESSMIYVVRPSIMGLAVPFRVYADDGGGAYLQGTTSSGSYIYFELPPGEHVIVSAVENTDKLRVVTKGGDILFIQQTPILGLIRAENILRLLPDDEGRYRVKGLRLGSNSAYAGAELDLRTFGKNFPPLTINGEGGYEYKINYFYEYGYPTYGFGINYWLWL